MMLHRRWADVVLTSCACWDFSSSLFAQVRFQFKGMLAFSLFCLFLLRIFMFNSNSIDPDQMPRSVAADLGLHCLQLSLFLDVTVLSTSLGKTFFAWRFTLNENILFCLTIYYQKPFVFYVSVFCSQIFTQKIKLRPKVGLTYAISIVKFLFGMFV